MTASNNRRITFINIIALIGYALLAFTSFMGAFTATNGSYGASIAISVGSVIVLFLIMAGAQYAKRQDTDLKKWKRTEIILIVAFWLVAIFPALYTSHFFKILSSSDSLYATAVDDVTSIKNMFDSYEQFEKNALDITQVGLETALGQPLDQPLADYFTNASISTLDDIEHWMLIQRGKVLGNEGVDGFSYIDFHDNVYAELDNWLQSIGDADMMFMALHGRDIDDIAPEVASRLTITSSTAQLPGVEFTSTGVYSAHPLEQSIEINKPDTNFSVAISGTSGSLTGYLLALLMLMLIFLDYIMTRRSGRTELQTYDLTGGNAL